MLEDNYKNERDNILVRREKIEQERGNLIFSEQNKTIICGIVEKELEYNTEVFKEGCYKTKVQVTRLSGLEDHVPIIIPESLLCGLDKNLKGKYVEVAGMFCSYNKRGKDKKRHLYLYVSVTDINVCNYDEERKEIKNGSLIYLDGHICKEPIFRVTPRGREIVDVILSVSTQNNKTDYIPCIAWKTAAIYIKDLKVGTRIIIYGRIQSRQYSKHLEKSKLEAYEVSVIKVIKVDEEN